MRVEGGARDGRRSVVVQEARVRLKGRQVFAINVEGLHFVAVGAARRRVSHHVVKHEYGIGTYTMNTGACSCTLNVRRVSFVA